MRTWDTRAIFAALGGGAALRDALREATGDAPDIQAIYMWTQRDRIAADWLPECVAVALDRRPDLSLLDLMTERTPAAPPVKPAPSVFPPYTGEMDICC